MVYPHDKYLQESRKYIREIDTLYFQVDECKFEYLPEELDLSYKDKILDDFKSKIERLFSGMKPPYKISETGATWVISRLMDIPDPFISEKDLKELYDKAVERTLSERIFLTNKTDVDNYFQALRNVTIWECKNHLLKEICRIMSYDPITKELLYKMGLAPDKQEVE